MGIEVVRYSERPELWEQLHGLAEEVWPEYSLHGDVINQYWARLYEAFPEWQFAIYADSDKTALAEGQTIPVSWDGTDDGLPHLIAPVRPSRKQDYPISPIERYARWTHPDGLPFDPWIRVHVRLGGRLGRVIPRSLRITGTIADWETWTHLPFPETGEVLVVGRWPSVRRLGRGG
jgi:hypothetical protein